MCISVLCIDCILFIYKYCHGQFPHRNVSWIRTVHDAPDFGKLTVGRPRRAFSASAYYTVLGIINLCNW